MTVAIGDKQIAFEMMIQSGADPSLEDNKEFSGLHSAAEGGNTSIINKLLSLGLVVDSRDDIGVTSLMTVAIGDKESAFETLIQNGADPSLKDTKEFSVLHSAAEGGKASIINELFLPGLNVDSRDNDGVITDDCR